MVNVPCKTKRSDIPIEMVLSSRSKDTEKFAYSFNYSLVRRYHGVYEREICKLYRKYIRVVVNERLY
jgi:hypothetical protein